MGNLSSELEAIGMHIPKHENIERLRELMRRSDETRSLIFLIDGLGMKLLRKTEAKCRMYYVEEIDSTQTLTAPTLLSLYSGKSVAEHGLVGCTQFLPSERRIVDDRGLRGKPDVFVGNDFFRSIDEKSGLEVFMPFYARRLSWAFANVHTLGTRLIRVEEHLSLLDMKKHVEKRVREGSAGCLFVYYADLDVVQHQFGPDSTLSRLLCAKTIREIREIALFAEQNGYSTFATSDHGQFKVDGHEAITIERNDKLLEKMILYGSVRLRFAIKKGQSDVLPLLEQRFGDKAKIMPSKEALESGMFGRMADSSTVRWDNFGEYVILPDQAIYIDGEAGMRHTGEHGGLTSQEIRVPFIRFEKR